MVETVAIVAIVERGKADHIVNRTKKAGVKGATILYGRGRRKRSKEIFKYTY